MIAKEFVIPKWVKIEEGGTERFSRFIVEPFERGYGTTIGNSLRRVLLASLEGAAVTAVRIEGVQHEFSAIPGVAEDMTDVVLKLKQCELRLKGGEPIIFSFIRKGQGEITAGDIFKDADVELFNPDLVVMNVTNKTTEIDMEIKVSQGRGYVSAESFEFEHAPLGTVYLDANFSPVSKVNFLVEDARVGQRTDYDRLLLDVWTNGSITPEKAVQEAAELLIEHLNIFVAQRSEAEAGGWGLQVEDPELVRKLSRLVDELELSVRAANCLKAANIRTVGDLVQRTEAEMLQFHNFGKKSLDEIKAILDAQGLELGMDVGNAAPPPPPPPSREEQPDEEADEEAGEDVEEEAADSTEEE